MQFKTLWNLEKFPTTKEERNYSPSMTIPDQSLSVKEILDRFARGLPLEGQRVPIYDGEENDMPDITHMDLADQQTIKENYQAELEELNQNQIKKQKAAASKKPAKTEPEEAEIIPEDPNIK